jgi:hypothetical protein
LGEGQLIRELKLGRVNHDRMRKCVKTVYVPESTYHRETFPPQRKVDTTESPPLEFDQSQEGHILNNPIGNLGNVWERTVHTIVLSQ